MDRERERREGGKERRGERKRNLASQVYDL